MLSYFKSSLKKKIKILFYWTASDYVRGVVKQLFCGFKTFVYVCLFEQ